MSADRVTEVTSQSWFSRIGGAIKGVLTGLVLIVVAFPLLFWNEGRAVKRYKTLKEGSGAVVSVAAEAVSAANEGKLVHVSGKALTDATLADPVFGVSAKALKLRRAVEMYQWEEKKDSDTKKKLGGGTETTTTYTYRMAWSDDLIDSADFKEPSGHQNPGAFPYQSAEWTAGAVTLGAFTLSPSLVGQINSYEPIPASADGALPESLKGRVTPNGAGYYAGTNPASPRVGDARITFAVVLPTDVSLVAKQVGQTFEPYQTKAGGALQLLQGGIVPADAMFQKAQESNKTLTWILRLVGFIVMLVGLNLVFRPLSVIADVVPFLGSIVGAGTGLVAFLVAATLSSVTIAIAWIVYRPLLGIALIAVAVALVVVIKRKLKRKPAQAAA